MPKYEVGRIELSQVDKDSLRTSTPLLTILAYQSHILSELKEIKELLRVIGKAAIHE